MYTESAQVQENMKEILDLLPQPQRQILELKMNGWKDSDIIGNIESLVPGINSIKDIRQQIDPLLTRLLKELSQAMDIINLLYNRKPLITNTEIEIGTYSKPALIIPGDFYDIINMDESRVGIALGDGEGHGLKACILANSVHAHLHSYAAPESQPSETLKYINQAMCQYCVPNEFVTLLYGILDIDSKSLLFSHAAHPYLIHYRCHTGDIFGPENLGSNWIPWPGDVEYFDECVQLEPGDVVVAWTDGITESLDRKDRFFGEVGLQSVIKQHSGLPAEALAKRIYQSAIEHSGALSLDDDATVVVLKRRMNCS